MSKTKLRKCPQCGLPVGRDERKHECFYAWFRWAA